MRERIQTIGFVIGSMLIHTAALLAITLSPTVLKTVSESGESKNAEESATGEAIQFYPSEDENAYPELAEVQPEPVTVEPVKVEPAKPVEAKPVAVKSEKANPAKKAVAKAKPKAKPAVAETLPEKSVTDDVNVTLMKKADAEKVAVVEETEPEITIEEESTSEIQSEILTAAPAVESADQSEAMKELGTEAADQPKKVATAAIVPGTLPMEEAEVESATPYGPQPALESAPATPADQASNGDSSAGVAKQSFNELEQLPGNKPPVYPEVSRLNKAEGQGELKYVVTKEGRVKDVIISKSTGHKELDLAAAEAVKNYKFVPGQEGVTVHPFIFKLKGDELPVKGNLRTTLNEEPSTN